jgi:hypothetical protein
MGGCLSEMWIRDIKAFVKYAEGINQRVEGGEADRLEIILGLKFLFQMLRESSSNWLRWFENFAVLANIDEEELRRLWRKIYPHIVDLLLEDARHTEYVEKRISEARSVFMELLKPSQDQRSPIHI